MQVAQAQWSPENQWLGLESVASPDLLLVFGDRESIGVSSAIGELRAAYPSAALVGCSSAGTIHGDSVLDQGLSATAIRFKHARARAVTIGVEEKNARAAAQRLGSELIENDLQHVFVLSEGLRVNGTDLARGFAGALPKHVGISGGLSGDGTRFERTLVAFNDTVGTARLVAVGLYGSAQDLSVCSGSLGGWDPFGPARLVTRSLANVLYELEGEPALTLYKRYLGAHAIDLPASGLLFPLSIEGAGLAGPLVRTILGIDAKQGSITFAGDVPEGAFARLMKANMERLIDGATGAAQQCRNASAPDLTILVSCVGRKLVLDQRVEEEVEAVRQTLGRSAPICGFYGYGELGPTRSGVCELHNQTMTVTTLSERQSA